MKNRLVPITCLIVLTKVTGHHVVISICVLSLYIFNQYTIFQMILIILMYIFISICLHIYFYF